MNRGGLPLVRCVAYKSPLQFRRRPVRQRTAELFQSRGGSVRGAIIHDDDFHAIQERRFTEQAETVKTGRDEMLLIICGNNNRE